MHKLIDSKKFHNMNATVETVRFDNGRVANRLVSYTSVVCDIDMQRKTVCLYPRHRYSRTTTRQVTRFLRERLGFPVCSASLDNWKRQEKRNNCGAFENGYYIYFPITVLGTDRWW